MDFDTLDLEMRSFEQSLDRCMLKGIYMVARLDGHGFTRLTKREWDLDKPFDIRFRDCMITTLRRLMDCGFRVIYAYSQSDEISLLFHLDERNANYCRFWPRKLQSRSRCQQGDMLCSIAASSPCQVNSMS